MRVFVTGASGWIGSAVVPELLAAGHEVVGLARSDASAAALSAAGAAVRRGTLEDLDALHAGAVDSDGVIHLAFIHDFGTFADSVGVDLRAVQTLGAALEGSGKPLLIASGVLGLGGAGRAATEEDQPDPSWPRAAAAETTRALAERGVRSAVVRLPPTVHGHGDKGFVAMLVGIAREKGISGYVGEGRNCWSAVHRLDAAHLYRLALDRAPAGSTLHAVADIGVPTKTIAEVIGRHLDVPVQSIASEDAAEHFGWMSVMFSLDGSATSTSTRELLHWQPVQPGLLGDLEAGHYFESPAREHVSS